jgi:hypothetical protein
VNKIHPEMQKTNLRQLTYWHKVPNDNIRLRTIVKHDFGKLSTINPGSNPYEQPRHHNHGDIQANDERLERSTMFEVWGRAIWICGKWNAR